MKRILLSLIMLIMIKCVFGTDISGHITHNATWRPEYSPYIVTSFLYIDIGATLTILPGVEVQVHSANKNNINNFYWSGANEPVAKMMVVFGKIVAKGTAQSPIKFNKYGDNVDLRWGGIYLTTQAQPSSFEYCEFRNTFFCNHVPGDESYGAIDFECGSINIRNCLFEKNYGAIESGDVNTDILIYGCRFISINDNYPVPFGPAGFLAIGALQNQSPPDYYKLIIAKCYFTGNARVIFPGYHMSITLLNNLFDEFTNIRNQSFLRLEDYGNTCDYGNLVLGGKIGLGCYSASTADTVFSRRNRMYTTTAVPSTIGGSGTGVNYITDNYLHGAVQFAVDYPNSMDTYFSNNEIETTLSDAIYLWSYDDPSTRQLRIFNNIFRNIDPDSLNYNGIIVASQLTPLVYNNTFVDYYTIMAGDLDADHFINNIFYNFSDFNAGSLSPNNHPVFMNNCLSLPFPDWGTYMDGGGNIITSPLFSDSLNGDFQLQAGSPCIDTGLDMPDLPAYDMRYYKRAVSGTGTGPGHVDMGAYEYNSVYIGGIQGYTYDSESELPIDCVKISIQGKLPEFTDTLGVFPYKTGAGIYTVKASRWDYDDVIIPNVVVNEGSDTVLNIPMISNIVGNEDQIHPEGCGTGVFNYPNPFNPSTTIHYTLQKSSHVNLTIYNVRGQKVIQLVNENMQKGTHNVVWDGKDGSGKACGSGVYFSRLETNGKVVTKKMVLLK